MNELKLSLRVLGLTKVNYEIYLKQNEKKEKRVSIHANSQQTRT